MTKTLFTGRLWFEATETELKEWFGKEGPVQAVPIPEDPDTQVASANTDAVVWARRWRL